MVKETTAIAIINQNDQLWTTSLDIAQNFSSCADRFAALTKGGLKKENNWLWLVEM